MLASLGLIQKTNAQSPVNFGIKGGVNFANLANSDDELDSRSGVHAGLVLDLSLPLLPIGIESGVYYSQKGAELTEENITVTGKIDYIEVPLMAKINVGPPGPFSPHFVIGPYAAYNVNAEFEASDGNITINEDLDDMTSDFDFGGVIGIGADFNLGITRLNLQARYSRGFLDINDDGFEEDSEFNSVFSISAGILF